MGLTPSNPIGQAPSSRQLLWQGTQQILNGSPVYSPNLDISQYNYLTFLFDTTAGSNAYYAVTPYWTYGFGNSESMIQDGMTFGPSGQSAVTVPAFAPGISVEIAQATNVNEPAITWTLYGRLAAALSDVVTAYGEPFISQNVSINAGGTYTLQEFHTYYGRLTLDVANTGTTNWNAYLDYYDSPSNTWINLYALNTELNLKGMIEVLAVPPSPHRLRVINRDTAAHNFTISEVAFR